MLNINSSAGKISEKYNKVINDQGGVFTLEDKEDIKNYITDIEKAIGELKMFFNIK